MRMGEKMKKLLSANKKKACGIAVAVVLLAGTAAGIAIVSGENSEPHLAKASQTAKNKVEPVGSNKSRTTKVEEKKKSEPIKKPEAIKKKAEEPENQETAIKSSEKKNAAENDNADVVKKQDTTPKENPAPAQVQTDAEKENNSGSNNNTGTVEQPKEPAKVWHDPVYEDKWVVDQAAWTEEVPVYQEEERCICNGCGADITNDPGGHMESAMLAGNFACGAWHSEWKQIQVGTNTINHPEQGHWEKVLVKEGYWE